ncbi:branched-chain amino acid transaminase [Desulfocurvus sp. DL9XJH121]
MVQKAEHIWFDGKLVPWDEANVHVLTHTLHYGCGVFEGIRAYKLASGESSVFRLKDHVHRHFMSAKIMLLDMGMTEQDLYDAIIETLQANKQAEGYIRPLTFIGEGAMGVHPADNPVHTIVATWPWGAYLGEEALDKGIRMKTSSFTRMHVNAFMTKAKVCGNYANSILAKREVVADGYDEALFLDTAGYVSEASGENIFIVRNGYIKTPSLTSILDGLTRNSLIAVARDLGYQIVEQRFTRDELYGADEAFLTGTAAELTPIREVDHRVIGAGKAGPVTKELQKEFFKVVKGENPKYDHWLDKYTI